MTDRGSRGRGRSGRADLTGEHALTDVGQLVLAILFFGGWIADMLFLRLAPSLAMYAPAAVRLPVGSTLWRSQVRLPGRATGFSSASGPKSPTSSGGACSRSFVIPCT